jgi:2,3-bisphosphoglycerate-dependent phosphoglycerate mutase
MTRMLLVRHCEISGQQPEAPLTEAGRAQAQHLAGWLAARGVDHVVSSPYRRAVDSITPFAAAAGLPLNVDPRLHERVIAAAPIPHWRDVVRRAFVDPDHREPGGESAGEVLARATLALDAVLEAGHRLPVVVSHGHLLALVLQAVDATFGFEAHAAMTNPDVYLLERADGGTARFDRLWTGSRPR